MANKDHLEQAAIVDVPDDQLKELLGALYCRWRNLEESRRNDQTLEEMRAKLKEYTDINYNVTIKATKARLKAARSIAALRGIIWKIPTEK